MKTRDDFTKTWQRYEDYITIVWITWAVGGVTWIGSMYYMMLTYHLNPFLSAALVLPVVIFNSMFTAFYLKHKFDTARKGEEEDQT